jgi:hypothetical protein
MTRALATWSRQKSTSSSVVASMRILEHEQDGLTARQPYELVDERLQCAGPLLLRRHYEAPLIDRAAYCA